MGHRFTREPSIISSVTGQEVDWALWRRAPDAFGDRAAQRTGAVGGGCARRFARRLNGFDVGGEGRLELGPPGRLAWSARWAGRGTIRSATGAGTASATGSGAARVVPSRAPVVVRKAPQQRPDKQRCRSERRDQEDDREGQLLHDHDVTEPAVGGSSRIPRSRSERVRMMDVVCRGRVRARVRGRRARPSTSGCSLRAARGRARRDSRQRPLGAGGAHTRSTTDRRHGRPHSPLARTPSCRRSRRQVPNAAPPPRGAGLAIGRPSSPSSSRAPIAGRGRRGVAADHPQLAVEHRHAANAERADGGCRRPAGDSSPYRARRTRPAAGRPVRRRARRRAHCAS